MSFRTAFTRVALINRPAVGRPMVRLSLASTQRTISHALIRTANAKSGVQNTFFIQMRFKKKGKEAQSKEDEEENEEESDEEVDDTDFASIPEVTTITSPSLIAEFVLTRCLFRSKAALEDAISKQRVRLNGEQVDSKKIEVGLGDVYDYIIGRNAENLDLLDVSRVTILSLGDKMVKGQYKIEVEKIKRLTINNYKQKWEGLSINSPNA